MSKSRVVTIGSYEYVITLSEEHQLQLFLRIPYEKTYKIEPLWMSWDDGENDDVLTVNDDFSFYNPDHIKTKSSVNPFKFSQELRKHILNFIKEYKVSYFYFIPNNYKKGLLYKRIYDQVKN